MLEPYVKKILSSRVYDVSIESPLTEARRLSERVNAPVHFKREDLQPVFSFKCRGAYNKIAQLTPEERARGVVAASAGNHAQGVALAAQKLGIRAIIVMGRNTPSIKIDAVKSFGARVILHGDGFDGFEHAGAGLRVRHAVDRVTGGLQRNRLVRGVIGSHQRSSSTSS